MKSRNEQGVRAAQLAGMGCFTAADHGSRNGLLQLARPSQAPGRRRSSLLLLLALSLTVGLLSACADAGGGTLSLQVATTNNQTTVAQGQMLQVMATMKNAKGNNAVMWSLSGANCPNNCGALSSTSANPTTYTAPNAVASNFMVTVTATSVQDPTKSSLVTLTVTPPPPITVTVTSAPPANLDVNRPTDIVVHVANDSSNAGLDWTLTCGGGACGSITAHTASDATNTYHAPPAAPPAPVTIKAASTADPTKSVSIVITITVPVISVSLSTLPPANLAVNAMANVVAHVVNDASNAGVDWTLTCGGGTCGSITAHTASDATNVYTAPAAVPAAAVTIKATSTADPTKFISANTTITPPPPIAVTFTTAPPANLAVNVMANVVAHVANDPSNAGVDWTLTCGGGTCGTITAHTASDATNAYTAPAAIPGAAVTIKATSTADPTKFVSANVAITAANPNNSKLNGHYAFELGGWEVMSGTAAALGGSFVADGIGNATSGVIDRALGVSAHLNEAFTGTYDISNDNRGTLNITITPSGATLKFRFALTANGNARIIVQTNNPDTNFQASGVLKKQDASAFALNKITGNYVFGIEGVTLANTNRSAATGRFTTNGTGSISSATIDVGAPLSATGALALTGNIAAPGGATGRGTLAFSATGINTINLAYYVVSASELLVVDVDTTNRILYTGSILAQNRPGGGFTAASFNSTVVFALTGFDVSHTQSNTGVGFVTGNGGGGVTAAFLDQNADATFVSAGTTGTYTFDADGNGRAILNLTGVQPNTLYFIDANKAFFLQGTPADVGEDVTFGLAEQQTAGLSVASFTGSYAFGTARPAIQEAQNFTGEIIATGATGTFAGTADLSEDPGGGPSQSDLPVSGTYQFTAGKNGRFTATLTPQNSTPIHLVLWFISPTRAVGVVSDATTIASAVVIFEQ